MSATLPPLFGPPDTVLRGRQWQRFLQGPDSELLDELYIPALSRAVRYDRCCAYFSSSVLSAAARGFGGLIAHLIALGDAAPRPAIRLIVNEELAEVDVRALTERGDATGLAESLLARFGDPTDALVRDRLATLGWLVREGFLSVRVGVMRQGRGILHAKYGIVTDHAGDAIIFAGSGNESAQGLFGNYEQLEVTPSWDDPTRHAHYTEQFAMLWDNRHPDVYTVTLPHALHLRLIQFAPHEPPVREPTRQIERERAAMRWRFIAESPYLANGAATCDATAFVEMWPHQRHVVDEVTAAWPDGRLLCDEVGMGKTIEAMLILRRLMAGRGVRRVLILLPAGLLKQWQTELREKGGLSIPRLEGTSLLVWPDDRSESVADLATALTRDALIVSRETVRSEKNAAVLYAATPWDLVILDEAHAARRSNQREGEYNSGTLLLDLLRNLQLRKQARGLLLLSATPMQTEPWEPWDLLAVLGEGGRWLSEFAHVRDFYDAIPAVEGGTCTPESARGPATTIAADPTFPRTPRLEENSEAAIAQLLRFAPPSERPVVARWMREGSPLARRMHRNTRDTLREYHRQGLLAAPPPRRFVEDVRFDFDTQAERNTYLAVGAYIEKRFEELESERPGKGFVMTIYRRRASSSSYALRRSMERRRDGLQRVIDRHAYDADLESGDVDMRDVDDYMADVGPVSAALPTDPLVAKAELHEVEGLLGRLDALGATDTKRDCFFEQLRRLTEDGRHVLVFSEYADTMTYLRDELRPHFGAALACYSGEGGQMWDGEAWRTVTKDDITRALHAGNIHVLLCTDAASEGLNLQAAAALINYDLPWNPSKIEQRIGRIDRIGQQRADVRIVNLFLRDSVDDRVYTVLRQRCGVFERFVGPMQPVLARARRILATPTADNQGEVGAMATLTHLANDKQQDTLLQETYIESHAIPAPAHAPAITRDDMVRALRSLQNESDFAVSIDADTAEITLEDSDPFRVAVSATGLENDHTAQPLSPLDERMRDIADRIGNSGARLPLIVASFQRGGFRSTVVYWVMDGTWQVVSDIATLESLLRAWGGTYPSPALWRDALDRARERAQVTVEEMESEATARANRNIEQQREAARDRLIAELGRFLVCTSADWTDLNAVWHEQMSRDNLSAIRLHRCYKRLGDWYSGWAAQIEDLRRFERDITEQQRKARLTGREIEAALDDPRWRAG